MFENIKNLRSLQIILLIASFIGLILLIVGWSKQSDTNEKEKIDSGQTLLMIGLISVVIGVFGHLMYSKNKEVKNELI